MGSKYDFSGWATRVNIKCSDGRTIMKDAFKDCDGITVPLVWNHMHDAPENILGHAMLRNRDEGVYAYCTFNDTDKAKTAKMIVEHGDIASLSICANRLKQNGSAVIHGVIREVSLVLAGANPGASIQNVLNHGEASDDEAIIYNGEDISLNHSDDEVDETKPVEDTELVHADDNKEDDKMADTKPEQEEKTVRDVIDSMTEEQQNVMYALIGQAVEGLDDEDDNSEGGNEMKHNVFEGDMMNTAEMVLTHADQTDILNTARSSSCGSFRDALEAFCEDQNGLQHGIEDIETLFPEYKDVRPGAPELITRDLTWVDQVMNKVSKSPISRIRTRQADARGEDLRALGYGEKGTFKKEGGLVKLLKRTTDPQTVYRKDSLHRDDILDITDFDVVQWQYTWMRQNLNEDLARAILIGDGRDEADDDKIHEDHIRSIWHDEELYTIHYDVDIDAARDELQGTDTGTYFGDNYVYAEALVTASLYSREQYKGSGNLEFYCTPHLLNVMLLARDRDGRRIYNSKADLQAALNVSAIHTVEQFEGLTRTTSDSKTKKLLGLFVNLSDYQVGCARGGEITRFNQFDINFNKELYLLETRLSGALTRIKSAIALEEPVEG